MGSPCEGSVASDGRILLIGSAGDTQSYSGDDVAAKFGLCTQVLSMPRPPMAVYYRLDRSTASHRPVIMEGDGKEEVS